MTDKMNTEWIKDHIPDFIEYEDINHYEESTDDGTRDVYQIAFIDDGDRYGFEVTFEDDTWVDDSRVVEHQFQRLCSCAVEQAIEDRID